MWASPLHGSMEEANINTPGSDENRLKLYDLMVLLIQVLLKRFDAGADDEKISEGGIPRAHDHDYVPEPIYTEYIPLEDDHEFSAEEQPLPPVDSPTALSSGYVADSDPEEDSKEEHADYPADRGDDDDDNDDDDDDDYDDDDDDDDDDVDDDDTDDEDEEPFE
ncbi:hypothetical protein Tco_0996175, partial [Tanacetum coccineum]